MKYFDRPPPGPVGIGKSVVLKAALARTENRPVIAVKPLLPDVIREIVTKYIAAEGVLIESPDLYISHVVKQSGEVPQSICDMIDESGKERIIDKRKVREMRHEAGVSYLDFTPMFLTFRILCVQGGRALMLRLYSAY